MEFAKMEKPKYFSIGMIRKYLEPLNLEEERIMYVYHYINGHKCETEEYKNILEFMERDEIEFQ